MMTNAFKWLKDVTAYANAGNLGEFLRIAGDAAPAQEGETGMAARKMQSNSSLAEFWHAKGNAYTGNVTPLR